MSKSRDIEFGNLICKFGDNDLLDFYEEVVRPAFFDNKLKRKYATTGYFFRDVELVSLGEINGDLVVGIAGVFVYDTSLKRTQYFDSEANEIVHSVHSIKSSPTAKFLLILNNHRLVYYRDVPNSPSLNQFRATFEYFLKKKNSAYISSLYDISLSAAKEAGKTRANPTKAQLIEMYPMPKVTLNPLTCSDEIGAFVNRFSVINDIKIIFTKTNSEQDNKGLFAGIQSTQIFVGSEKSELRHHSTEGLSIDASKSHIIAASEQGNQFVSLTGKDKVGNALKGNNEDFQLKVKSNFIGDGVNYVAKSLFGVFKGLVSTGSIVIPDTPEKVRLLIVRLISEIKNV